MRENHSDKCRKIHPDCLCLTCKWDARCREVHLHFYEDEPPGKCKKTTCKHYEQEEKLC